MIAGKSKYLGISSQKIQYFRAISPKFAATVCNRLECCNAKNLRKSANILAFSDRSHHCRCARNKRFAPSAVTNRSRRPGADSRTLETARSAADGRYRLAGSSPAQLAARSRLARASRRIPPAPAPPSPHDLHLRHASGHPRLQGRTARGFPRAATPARRSISSATSSTAGS